MSHPSERDERLHSAEREALWHLGRHGDHVAVRFIMFGLFAKPAIFQRHSMFEVGWAD